MGMEVHIDGNGKLWLEFSMNIVKLVFIPLAFHYNFSSSIGLVYKEENVMSRVSSVGDCWNLVTTNYQEQIWILLFCFGYNQIDQVRIWIGIAFINQFLV
jgi:hypothetical protein